MYYNIQSYNIQYHIRLLFGTTETQYYNMDGQFVVGKYDVDINNRVEIFCKIL